MKMVFTTGQVATICKVSTKQVGKWFDSGRLKGTREGERQDRKIPREELRRFLTEQRLGEALSRLRADEVRSVLLLSPNQTIGEELTTALDERTCSFQSVATLDEMIDAMEKMPPDCIIVHFAIGAHVAEELLERMSRNSIYDQTIRIGLLSRENSQQAFDRSFLTETFTEPIEMELVAYRIQTYLERMAQQE
jgi:PleD family two-component response regulator